MLIDNGRLNGFQRSTQTFCKSVSHSNTIPQIGSNDVVQKCLNSAFDFFFYSAGSTPLS